MTHNITKVITGHDLLKPDPADAPLEFENDPDLVDKCREAVDGIRRSHTADAVQKSLEEEGFTFEGGDA